MRKMSLDNVDYTKALHIASAGIRMNQVCMHFQNGKLHQLSKLCVDDYLAARSVTLFKDMTLPMKDTKMGGESDS